MLYIDNFDGYKLIDTSRGEKLEKWGDYYLLRPDPTIIWDKGDLKEKYYGKINAIYHRSNKGGGYWENIDNIPDNWIINYKNLKFNIREMGFKHTGLFPEQASNWDYMMDKITKENRKIKVLNLFAYTGGATIACMKAGAHVTHVDSSKGMIEVAKKNVEINKLDTKLVRYIQEDVIKFVKREIRRGNKYDAIIMDPPSYGRGANKEVWNIEDSLSYLVDLCSKLLSDNPLFLIINSYSGLSYTSIDNLLSLSIKDKFGGEIDTGEIGIKEENSNLILPCGIYARWEK